MLPSAPIPVYSDVVNKKAYSSSTGASFTLPQFFFGDVITFQIYLMTPADTGSPTQPQWTAISASGLSAWMAIGDIAGAYKPLTYQDVWNPDRTNSYLTAQLPINTITIQTTLGTNQSLGSTFNITLFDVDGSARTVYQVGCTINQVPQNPGAAAGIPLSVAQYLTAAQCLALFVKFAGNPAGATLTLTDANGVHKRILGVDVTGTAIDDET